MDINQFSIYTAITRDEVKEEDDVKKVNELVQKLNELEDMYAVKTYLKDNWGIRDDISNFAITKNVLISTVNGAKYYNVSVKSEKEFKSFNFNKGE